MYRSKFFYVCYFLLPIMSFFYNFSPLMAESFDVEGSDNLNYISEGSEHRTECLTPKELDKLISGNKFCVKSKNVKKKVLHKKNSWDKLILLTGDVNKDFNSIISLLETSKNTNWHNWKLMPKTDPLIIRSDYITEINGHKVRASLVTYAETKETFLQNAWVISE